MLDTLPDDAKQKSHPSRVRGLKYKATIRYTLPLVVAPFAGAWIEISKAIGRSDRCLVAPFAGAWIEIGMTDVLKNCR